MMFVTALIASLVTTVLATLFSVIKSDRRGSVFNFDGSNLGAAVITFIVVLFADWGALYWNFGRPIWAGAGWIGFMVINLIIVTIIFGIASMAGDLNATPFVSVGTILVILVGVLGLYNNFWLGQDSATTLATQLNVKIIDQNEHGAANATELVAKVYPPTDANHMVIVGDQAARNIANRVMNQQNVGTRYTLGDGNLQSVAGHMFYVFDLRTSDIRSAGTVNYEAPGYVKVDAENPDAQPELVTQLNNKPLTLKYLLNGYYASNVERYAYEAFPNYYVDDLSLEIDDTGRPFWTASLNSAPIRMLYGVPVKFISIDAQTGDIQQYGLDKIPSWVDRVYSKATAKTMLEWWGHWGAGPQNAPYQPFYEGNNNRYKVSGDLNLVYTDEGPAWQALMTSYASDTAVQFVALMDTRSNYVRMYPAPEGIQIESHIVDAINSSGNNLKGLDPTHLVMHKVFGQLVWVGSLVAKGAGGATDGKFPQAQSFQGVSLLTSTSADAAKVIIGTSKGDALGKLSQQIASGSNNANPNAGGLNKTVQGTVAAATIITETGNSTVLIRLVGDKDNVYSGPVTTNDAKTLQRAVAKAGDKVTITYLDTGSPIRNIASYTTTAEAVPVG